jgi:hypothetical protein
MNALDRIMEAFADIMMLALITSPVWISIVGWLHA